MTTPVCLPPPVPITTGAAADLTAAARAALRRADPGVWEGTAAASYVSLRQQDLSAAVLACTAVTSAGLALVRLHASRIAAQLAYQGQGALPGVGAGGAPSSSWNPAAPAFPTAPPFPAAPALPGARSAS